MSVKVSPIPTYGDIMTIEEFIECCECGAFIDYDGFGEYCLKNVVVDDEWVKPSDVKKGKLKKFYTHIVWYNR